MELRSLAVRESPELLGMDRIPNARRIKIANVNMISNVKIKVEDDDFRVGNREYLGFAIGSPIPLSKFQN